MQLVLRTGRNPEDRVSLGGARRLRKQEEGVVTGAHFSEESAMGPCVLQVVGGAEAKCLLLLKTIPGKVEGSPFPPLSIFRCPF